MLNKFNNIAVIGAGTMGIGIAEVAASCNQKVKVFDLNHDFALANKQKVADRLTSRVKRGKISEQAKQQILTNIEIINELNQLVDCQLVIEAIVEDLAIKQKLFKQLQSICAVNTLFASNTSSISITAIASALDKPENMIGLHFFNPAPVMKLVEVVAGIRSSKENLAFGMELCGFWNKTAVLAQSTPGFIVNRVARPFYGEALKLLQEQVADVHTVDKVMTTAGFRMGPFTLMDLIGIDINLSVSKTVYAAMYNDPRYRPSFIQEEMVAANILGKKTARGFYLYDETTKPLVNYTMSGDAAKIVSISKDCGQLSVIASMVKNNDNVMTIEHESGACLQVNECAILLSNGLTCNQRVEQVAEKYLCQIDLVLDYENCEVIHLAFDSNCSKDTINHIVGMFQAIGKKVILAQDTPALIALRTVCLLINEAADAIENGVCSENDVDLAMQKGVNYPIGLINWAYMIGIEHVVEVLDNLQSWFGDDRYRVSSWLRQKIDYHNR